MDKTCATCRAGCFHETVHGECRLHPPIFVLSGHSEFPDVAFDYWCLDWQKKEQDAVEKVETKRKTICPPDFTPDERACQLAKGQGQNVHALCAAFKDHYAANGETSKDWQAKFRNWLRNDIIFKQKGRS